MSADANKPEEISQETKAALQEKWAAGRDADEAAEKRAAEKTGEKDGESPERKRISERLGELRTRIREAWQELFGSKPVEDAALEKRYGEGMTDEEKAEDAALVAKGDKEREQAESTVAEIAEHGEPRLPASGTPVHEALASEADKRSPEEERSEKVFEMVRQDIDAAAKQLDSKLGTSLEDYGGRRVVRVTHADRPQEVTWLVPVGKYLEDGGGLAQYLATGMHKTYNEKMAKAEAARTAKAESAAAAWKKAEAAIEAVGDEQLEAEARATETKARESAAQRAAKLARQHEIMLGREADLESRVAMIEDVRAGRLQRDDLEDAQVKWLGQELTDDKTFNLLKRELADLKSRRSGAASELGLPDEKPSEPGEPANIVIGEEKKPALPKPVREDLPKPVPGSLPPGVPDRSSPPPKPAEKALEITPLKPRAKKAAAKAETPPPPATPAEEPPKEPAAEKEKVDPKAALQQLIDRARASLEEPGNFLGELRSMDAMNAEDIPKVQIGWLLDTLKSQKRAVDRFKGKPGDDALETGVAKGWLTQEQADAVAKAGLTKAYYAEKAKMHQEAVDLARKIIAKLPEGEAEKMAFVKERTAKAAKSEDARSYEERFSEQLAATEEAPRIEIAPPVPVAETAAALGVAAKIGELAEEAGKEQEKREKAAEAIMKSRKKEYDAAWKEIGAYARSLRGDAGALEGMKEMLANAKALGKNEPEMLNAAVGMKLIAKEDVDALAGTEAAREVHRLFVKLHEDALREAENAPEGAKAADQEPTTEAPPQAPAAPEAGKRRIDTSRLANEADFLVKRWAELGAAGRPNSKMEESFNALHERLGGDATPEGRAFGDFLGKLMEKHEAVARGASEEDEKKLDDAARKAFVAFRDIAEPRRPAEKPARKRGGRGRGRGQAPKRPEKR